MSTESARIRDGSAPADPSLDPIEAWILAHPWGGDGSPAAAGDPSPEAEADRRRREHLAGIGIGSYCVNRALFEQLRELEGRRGQFAPVAPAETWPAEVRRIRGRVARTLDAWRLAEREHAAGRRSSPAFAILGVTASSDRAKPSPRKLTPEQRARQRHRYKDLQADNLDTFGRRHLRRDPRNPEYRQRWLDHTPDCRAGLGEGRRCRPSCGRIRLPELPRWARGKHRRRRDWISTAEWLIDRAAGIRNCQEVIGLRDDRCGGILVLPQSCHVRTCPDCESARQARIVGKYMAAAAALDLARCGFLTITVANVPRDELARGLGKLQDDLTRLRRRALWKGGRCRPGPCRECGRRKREHAAGEHRWIPVCRRPADPARPGWQLPHEPITASVASLEITANEEARTWHPHAHLLVEGWIDQAELSDAWRAITADSEVVWIESIERRARERFGGSLEGAMRDALKYSAKPQPAYIRPEDPALLAELLLALRGRRMVSSTGSLYGLGLDEDEDETPADSVLVWPDNADARRPYTAPRLCPHHGDEAAWRVLAGTRLLRRDCTAAPDRNRPGRSVLTHPPPPA